MYFKKDPKMKYTEMCMFVDANMHHLVEPDCPDELQNTMYSYLWLLVKALAIKKHMFQSFEDYDGYAFFSANRLFFSIKRNLNNQGKIVRGKEVRPIKSCLNYTKALLYPMKVDYLRQEKNINTEATDAERKLENLMYKQDLALSIWQQSGKKELLKEDIVDYLDDFDRILDNILKKMPFVSTSIEYKRIKMSILLRIWHNLLNGKELCANEAGGKMWKMPKTASNYVGLFSKELAVELYNSLVSLRESFDVDTSTIDYMITNPSGEFVDNNEN